MGTSTWNNIIGGLHTATYNSYAAKSSRQRAKREVEEVMEDVNAFCQRKQDELYYGTYRVGPYRHFRLKDKKKERDISVLPYEDRCVQNDVKDAIQPVLLHQMTDDMMGGLPGCGVLAKDPTHQVVARMRVLMNDRSLKYYLQGDIRKFYDHVDNVISMKLIERQVKDPRTRAVIRQHLFNQKRLAIGDPFSHLIANLNMSVIIRKAKELYGDSIKVVNFADDFIAFSNDKTILNALRRDMQQWAKAMRLHYSERSMGSYKGIIEVADTKELKKRVQYQDNRTMNEKIRRPFAGRPMKIETMEGIPHTIVNMKEKPSRQKDSESYFHIQAIADGLGLVVYSTGSTKICEYLKTKSIAELPLRDMKIVHDWSGFYYEGTVYTDAEEEEMIRRQFNIPRT